MKNTMRTEAPLGATQDLKAEFFLWGLIGEETFDLRQICPSGVSEIAEVVEFGDVILGCLTCGIYQPISIHVSCAGGSAYNLIPDEDSGKTWVLPTTPIVENGEG